MLSKGDSAERRERAISACLNQFCQKGLYETTSRDLSSALKLQSGGMYSYFSSKDEAVLVCAEEAAFLLEKYLVKQALRDMHNPQKMFAELIDRAEKLSHMMRFFAQVCSVAKYREGMEPVLRRLTDRYEKYACQVAEKLGCSVEEIAPYFYMCVAAVANYMIFGTKETVTPLLELAKGAFETCLNRKKEK